MGRWFYGFSAEYLEKEVSRKDALVAKARKGFFVWCIVLESVGDAGDAVFN